MVKCHNGLKDRPAFAKAAAALCGALAANASRVAVHGEDNLKPEEPPRGWTQTLRLLTPDAAEAYTQRIAGAAYLRRLGGSQLSNV